MIVRIDVLDASGQVAFTELMHNPTARELAEEQSRLWERCYWATEIKTEVQTNEA